MAAILKTVHGEPLETHRPNYGTSIRRVFPARTLWCPTCNAAPNRRCTWSPTELVGTFKWYLAGNSWSGNSPDQAAAAAKRNTAAGRDHEARQERAAKLTGLAELGWAHLALLGVRASKPAPEQKQTTGGLPLFALTPQPQES